MENANNSPSPNFALEYKLDAPHSTGNGILHNWILQKSRQLLIKGFEVEAVNRLLLHATQDSGRPLHVLEIEIRNAIAGAEEWLAEHPEAKHYLNRQQHQHWQSIGWQEIAEQRRLERGAELSRRDNRSKYKKLDQVKQLTVLNKFGKFEVRDLVEDSHNHLEEFSYAKLFGDIDFNVCCAGKVQQPVVLPLSRWLDGEKDRLRKMQFIVPNYMLEPGGGGEFKRDVNVGKRLYIVVEFDFKDESIPLAKRLAWQVRLLWHLREKWPLAMVVYSGSKSLHGWFACFHADEHRIRTFFRMATGLGADRQMIVPSQYCRMPWGTNYKTGRRQAVVFFNSELIRKHNQLIQEVCA